MADGTVAAWGDNSEGQTSLAGLAGVTRVAAGGAHSLALLSDGTVVASGSDSYGQCEVPPGLTGVIAIAAGEEHSLALRSNGTVVAWGSNGLGQSSVPSSLTDVKAIAAGAYHSLALRSNGTVVAWGSNGFGQSSVPSNLTGIEAIAAGGYHSLALRSNGTVTGWGRSAERQLLIPAGLSGVVEIAAGFRHSLALKSNGTVVAWGGMNAEGIVDPSVSVPPALDDVVAISAGWLHSLALRADGTPVGWGLNQFGQSLGTVLIDPAPYSKDVPTDAVFRLTYSAPVKAGTAYGQVRLEDGQGGAVAVHKRIEGTRLIITPAAALLTDERYVLRVPEGSLVDDYGNISSSVTHSYDTLDTIPPTVVAVQPLDGADGVSVHRLVSVGFSERIAQGPNIDEITLVGGSGDPVECRYSILTDTLVVTPLETLDPETRYTLTVPPAAVTDPSGNPLQAHFSSSFTTGRTRSISALAGAGGRISPSGEVIVDQGADRTFAITADDRYEIARVLVDGMPVELTDGTYTFENVMADHTITATFVGSETYTLSYTAGVGGTISGTTPQAVPYGSDGAPVTAVPGDGYRFVRWSDGVTDNPRTDTSVTGSVAVTAEFSYKTYAITASAGAGGTISPVGEVTVGHGTDRSFTVTPGVGYRVAHVLVDGEPIVLAGDTYTFTNVTADHAISVTFALQSYALTYSAGDGGAVEGALSQTVDHSGSGSTVTAVPDPGYEFVRWSDWRTDNPRTDANVTAEVTAEAIFATGVRTINASAGTGGALTPAGQVRVGLGSSQTFTVTPGVGYKVATVLVDGMPAALSGGVYTFADVTEDHTIHVTFSLKSYTLTYTAGTGGTLSGTTSQTVAHGSSGTPVTAQPSTGYRFVRWSDGRTDNPRTDTDVTASLTVSARFEVVPAGPDPVSPLSGVISGPTRYATAIAGSKSAYPKGAPAVVIATGEHFADALGGAGLAGALDSPLLLTEKASLPGPVMTEIGRLEAKKAYILGGTGAVSGQVESALKARLGERNVIRIAGANRYQTADRVAAETIKVLDSKGGYTGDAFVATGANFPDALGASPVAASQGMPVFLADPARSSISFPGNVKRVWITGGTAVVSAQVESSLKTRLGTANVKRLAGGDRFATAAEVAKFGVSRKMVWEGVGITTGANFPDALAAGPVLGSRDAVMLLTDGATVPTSTRSALSTNRAKITRVTFFGGDAAVPPGVRTTVNNLIR